jgi:hypothetical protein
VPTAKGRNMANEETGGKTEAVCPRCGRRFACGVAGGRRECWCMEKPALPPSPGEGGPCLCPACFDRLLSERGAPGA